MKYTFKKIILSGLVIVLALGIAMSVNDLGAQSSDLNIPPQRLVGHAWSENIGWISFNDGSEPVTLADTGDLLGYAWSENIGWVQFGGLSDFPDTSKGSDAKLVGNNLTGWARALGGVARRSSTAGAGTITAGDNRGGWDGWISLEGVTLTGPVSGTPPKKSFEGYAWGSDVVGWVTFDKVGVTSNLGGCIGPYGTVIADGQSFTYYSEPAEDGSCQSEDRICSAGVLSGSYAGISCGDDDSLKAEVFCTRAGKVLKKGETIELYSRSSVRAGLVCEPYKDTLTCQDGKFLGSDGLENTTHVYSGCRPLPGYNEF